jgi:hypothetical protein
MFELLKLASLIVFPRTIKARFFMGFFLLGWASATLALDAMVGKRYQITTLMGTTAKTYTLVIDTAGAGGYYSGILVGENVEVRMRGPKTGSQICMTSEPLYDTAFTFCFNATVRNDKKAFTTVTTWADEYPKVVLFSDVWRSTTVRYRLKPTSAPAVAQVAPATNDDEARIQRGLEAFRKLETLKLH